jgi:hypothetical protein
MVPVHNYSKLRSGSRSAAAKSSGSATLTLLGAETLAEGRSKVRDAKEAAVLVVGADFLAGVKTEGVTSMLKQANSYL